MPVRYLLDTDIIIYIAKHNPPEVRARFARHKAEQLGMSVVTFGELHYGAEKSHVRKKSLAVLKRLEEAIRVIPLSNTVGLHYGQIRAALEKKGRLIGNNDLWIAAHARAEGWILVTNNEREFSRIEGLRVENWAV